MPLVPCVHPVNTCLRNQTEYWVFAEEARSIEGSPGREGQWCGNLDRGRVIPRGTLHLFVMANGKVDFFNDTGGYGFISTDDDDVDDEDVFFHMEDVGGPDLEEGQEVEFDIESSPKGPRATNLVRN